MPGDKKHHTDKWRRCVEEVQAKGHDKSSAAAICTTSLQNAGEEIFEERGAEEAVVHEGTASRELMLCGTTGTVRHETLNGKKYLVVPVIALMEGVIHPVNAETPEFVSQAVLERAAASWVGKPVTLFHPKRNGRQCSADDPEVRRSAGLGVIVKSAMQGKKLHQEAWLEEEKTKQLHPALYTDLEAGKTGEVSVGAFVRAAQKKADYNGKPYQAEWLEAYGDHLAFLPGGRGACSCDMGCGTHRAAMHFIAAESIEARMPVEVFTTLQEESLNERISKVEKAVYEKWSKNGANMTAVPYSAQAYPVQVYDDRVIVRKGDEWFSVDYTIDKDGAVTLGTEKQVKHKESWVPVAAADKNSKTCAVCMGLGNLKMTDGSQKTCDACDGNGKMKVAEETPPVIKQDRVQRDGLKWNVISLDGKKTVLARHDNEHDARQHADELEKVLAKKCG